MRYDLLIDTMEWSYSRLTAFENCPYQWLSRYIYGIKGSSKFFAQYGSFMHKILQMYFQGELSKDDLVPYYLSSFLISIDAKAPNQRIFHSYLEQGRQYLSELPIPPRKVVAVEEKLQFEFAGHPFIGFMDLLSEDPDGCLYLTDHKSRALKPRSNRRKPTLSDKELDEYLRQLYIYAYAINKKYGRYPDYLEFNCFRTKTWISEPFKYERMLEVEKWAGELIDKITRNDNWAANVDFWFCKYLCDCSGECEYLPERW